MRKEILFAVIAGVTFGIIVAFGVWRANSALKSKPAATTAVTPTPSTPSSTSKLELTLAKPEDNDVIVENPTDLSGVTRPGSWVVISTDGEDYILKADTSGVFSQEINLIGGLNTLAVTALDGNEQTQERSLTVVYSSEFAKDAEIATSTESAKP